LGLICLTDLPQTHARDFSSQAATSDSPSRSQKLLRFLLTAKGLADQLAAVGKGVDDEDLISYVVGGLNSSYHPFITTLSFATRDTPISFDSFQTELLNHEQLLDASQKSIQPEGGQFAFFTQKQKSQQYSNKKQSFSITTDNPSPYQQPFPPQQQMQQFSGKLLSKTLSQQGSPFLVPAQHGKNMSSPNHLCLLIKFLARFVGS
jgi:hypothetical protein